MPHDDDTGRRVEGFNLTEEAALEDARTLGAAQVVLVRARVLGCSLQFETPVRPFLTSANTIGLVNLVCGTAWDTSVGANEGVSQLGFLKPRYTTFAPKGWRALDLPGWRGYGGTPDNRRVPSSEIRRDTWIQPQLVQARLRTLEGSRGIDPGDYLFEIGAMAGIWPWGLPPWFKGTSTTILDCALLAQDLTPSCVARGSDALEFDRASMFLHFVHEALSREHCDRIDRAWAYMAQNEPCTAIECATALASSEGIVPSRIHEFVFACTSVCQLCTDRVATNTGLCLACRQSSPDESQRIPPAPNSRPWPSGDPRKIH